MRLRSFKLRMALLSAGTSGLVLVGMATFFSSAMARFGLERIDREIQALADAQVRTPKPRDHWKRFDESLAVMHGEGERGQYLVRVDDLQGRSVYRSSGWPVDLPASALGLRETDGLPDPPGFPDPRWRERHARGLDLPPPMLPVAPARWCTVSVKGRPWRFVVMDNGEVRLAIGTNLLHMNAEIRRFRRMVGVATPIVLLLLAAFGWGFANQAIRPVDLLASVARGITAKGLDQRVRSTDADREFQALIDVINGMLDRLQRSFEQATRFGADAAHELKTPLAILQGQLQQALREAPAGSCEQQRLAGLIEEVQRLKVIVRKLLLLARADAGQMRLAPERVNLSEELAGIVEDVRQGATGLSVSGQLAPGIVVEADPDLLRQAFQNLASNAIKHNREGGTVAMDLTVSGTLATFRVANSLRSGAGIDRDRLFERFYRADPARGRATEGVGLGLSLAREILRAHGGDVRLDSLTEGDIAFVATLPLPTAIR